MPLNSGHPCSVVTGCWVNAQGVHSLDESVPLSTRVTSINRPAGTITLRSDYGAVPIRPDPLTYTDEAYTYSAEQIRDLANNLGYSDGIQARVRSYASTQPMAWAGVFNVQDRFTPAAILKEPYRTVGGVEQRDWKVAWSKMWRQVGAAHEAKIFCKEVTYKDGELLIR